MFRLFSPKKRSRFSRFDLWVYALFVKRWTRHFTDYPDMRKAFITYMTDYDVRRSQPLGKLHAVPLSDSLKGPSNANDNPRAPG